MEQVYPDIPAYGRFGLCEAEERLIFLFVSCYWQINCFDVKWNVEVEVDCYFKKKFELKTSRSSFVSKGSEKFNYLEIEYDWRWFTFIPICK